MSHVLPAARNLIWLSLDRLLMALMVIVGLILAERIAEVILIQAAPDLLMHAL